MLTVTPPPVVPLALSWRIPESLWPDDLDSPTGLDPEAQRLVRLGLTLAVEHHLWLRRSLGEPRLPRRPCRLQHIRQRRFNPRLLHWHIVDELRDLLRAEVAITLELLERPHEKRVCPKWDVLLEQQCARIGQVYLALKAKIGRLQALYELEAALALLRQAA